MRILAFHILTGQLRFAVLEGTKQSPMLLEKGRLVTLETADVGELMNWFETNFDIILNRTNPNKVVYRLTLDPSKDQLINVEFPLGILHLLCYKRHIPTNSYSSLSYVPSKLGLPKGTDLYEYCDNKLGTHPPYWDKNQKNAVLAAWFELP